MAHFARVNAQRIVEQTIVAEQDHIDTLPDATSWVQTSYNTRGGVHYDPATGEPSADQSKALRKNFAGIGDIYDSVRDAFYKPQPYPSWILNENTWLWEAPVAKPTDDQPYYWDEAAGNWVVGMLV